MASPLQARTSEMLKTGMPVLLILGVWAAFHTRIIGFPTGPFEGSGDTTGWEYSGFFLFENLKFAPFPSLKFFTDTTFYPFGTSAVFQAWGIERDYVYAIMRKWFGLGPWLFFYVSFARLFCALFIFFLLRRRFGEVKALIAGLGTAFFSIYSLAKYPHHYGISVCHWAMISVFIDCCIVKDYLDRRTIGPFLILIRGIALVLSLGHDIGYIAGMSLSSGTICLTYIAYLEFKQLRAQPSRYSNIFTLSWQAASRAWKSHPIQFGFLLTCLIAVSYFIVPLVIQIFLEAKSLEAPEMFGGGWRANPSRLFLPHFEVLNPNNHSHFIAKFSDGVEGYGENSPGWFLLGLAMLGLLNGRKSMRYQVPFVILFLMVLFYSSTGASPTMKIFPWYKFARVSGRLSFILAPLCLVFFLQTRFFDDVAVRYRRFLRFFVAATLSLILFFEASFVYGKVLPEAEEFQMPSGFVETMNEISQQPGEALFEWPFCVSGGNLGSFCSSGRILGSYGFRKYHTKKVNGGYFGRLSIKAAATYDQSGITDLLKAQSERCLTDQELDFLYRFYLAFDYAGMLVYHADVPDGCLDSLFQRFGAPTRSVEMLSSGLASFIPKAAELRSSVNREAGLKMSLSRAARVENIFSTAEALWGSGLRALLGDNPDFESEKNYSVVPTTDPIGGFDYVLVPNSEQLSLSDYIQVYSDNEFRLFRRRSPLDEAKIEQSLVSLAAKASRSNILELKLVDSEIYMHPDASTARLEFEPILVTENAILKFGVALRNPSDGVRFSIKTGDTLLWETEITVFSEWKDIVVDLSTYAGQSIPLTLEIDPLKSNSGDWSYWINPSILVKSEP